MDNETKQLTVLCNFTKNPARLQQLGEQIRQALDAFPVNRDSGRGLRPAPALSLLSGSVRLELVLDPERWQEVLPRAEVIGTYALPPEDFARCEKLRWLHLGIAGVEKSLHAALVQSEVVVTNARGIHSDMMAEYVLAAILTCAHRFDIAAAGRATKVWRQKEIVRQRHSIAGKTVGIIGTGAIGTATAQLCRACGMRVMGMRRSPEKGVPEGFEEIWGPEGLDHLLAAADYVVLAAPLTAETQRLLGVAQLTRMKPGAFLINIARGALVDEDELVVALQEKKIAGAVLDVFVNEPLPPESPLWNLDNVFITPHVSGNFEQYVERVGMQFAENLARYLRGEALQNVVDKSQGY